MDPLIPSDKRRSPRVPAQVMVMGETDGRQIMMYSENISLDGMFLHAKDFISPRAVFTAQVWLSEDEEPLRMYLTCCFIERTSNEYGVGVYISGMSTYDRMTWEAYYRCCVDAYAKHQHLAPSCRTLRHRCLVVVGGALGAPVIEILRTHGLEVSHAPSVSAAIGLVQAGQSDAVISTMRSPKIDGLALCYAINAQRLRTRTVLLTDSMSPIDFWLAVHAGAARVIAKPCSIQILVTRVLEVMERPIALARALSAEGRSRGDRAVRVGQMSRSSAQLLELRPSAPARSGVQQVSRYLGRAYRYLSERIVSSTALGNTLPVPGRVSASE